jgi:hypothetical protein
MSEEAVFTRSGDAYLPTVNATGPWSRDNLHGGPVLGLLARAIEAHVSDPDLVCARLSVDMFRPVPHAPLTPRAEVVRQGGRLVALQAGLFAGDTELARASALYLRQNARGSMRHLAAPPPHEGLPIEALMRGNRPPNVPRGFHTQVQTRWPARTKERGLAVWFRLPLPLVAAEETSALQRAVALCDFANAVASIGANNTLAGPEPYINCDASVYFSRRPVGEWFCLEDRGGDAEHGVSVHEVSVADEQGPLGRVLQARLLVAR